MFTVLFSETFFEKKKSTLSLEDFGGLVFGKNMFLILLLTVLCGIFVNLKIKGVHVLEIWS
jgi:hypothetical protein